MASDVRGALVELMAAPSRLNSRDAAVKKLAEMQLKGRYLQVMLPPPDTSPPPCAQNVKRWLIAASGRLELKRRRRTEEVERAALARGRGRRMKK
jgi:hypothetical protein